MSILSKEEQQKYFDSHLRHRLTLLLTLRNAKARGFDIEKQGDFYRCAKDSNLIGVRLFMDFLGFYIQDKQLKVGNASTGDNIRIDKFIERTLVLDDVAESMRPTLFGVYNRATKELAHFTAEDKYNEEFNTDEKLIEAAESIEYLLKEHLYGNKSIQFSFPQLNDNFYY